MSTEDAKPIIPISINDVGISNSKNSVSNAITNNIYGFNHRQTGNALPTNKLNQGYVFFTRPQLNMSLENLKSTRYFNKLLNENEGELSLTRYIRCMLDPRLQTGTSMSPAISCPLSDSKQAFIPCLTNQLISVSGFSDKVVPTMTTPEGMYKESYFIYDGIISDYTVRDINCTFRNTIGSIAYKLLDYWMTYGSLLFQFLTSSYNDFIIENEVDYQTRIYRIVLDSSKRYVEEFASTGVSAPYSLSTGAAFDFSVEKPLLDANKEFSVPFKSSGMIMNDEITLFAFNQVVKIFHPAMRDEYRNKEMIAIPYDYLSFFNFRGYPFINLNTYEFLWYIERSYFEKRMRLIDNIDDYLYNT